MPSSHWFFCPGSFIRKQCSLLLSALLAVCLVFSFPIEKAEAKSNGVLVVAVDPGHGGGEAGAHANGVNEEEANWDIAVACVNELNTYSGVKAVLTKSNDQYMDREERIDSAVNQGAGIVVSIHCNSASTPSANGSEVWIPNDSAYLHNETHVVGKGVGNSILSNLASSCGLYNRGVKTRNCTDGETYPSPGGLCDWYGINYWARWKGICGIIVEHAFVTNGSDAAKLASPEWRVRLGRADAKGIAEYYGLSKTTSGGSDVSSSSVSKTGESVTTQMAREDNPAIMGTSMTSVDKMVAWFKSKNKTFPSLTYAQYGASSIEQFCDILFEEAQAEGVRAEVVFTQAMKETGWLSFGGQVSAEQCNFCGLGATDGGAAGADFRKYGSNAVRMGLRAQIQHLKAYASTDSLKKEVVDPRFSYVTRGCAPKVKDLTGRWATSQTYGDDLARMINDLLGQSVDSSAKTSVKINLADVPDSVTGKRIAYVDGVATTLNIDGKYGFVDVSGSGPHSVTMYEYNSDSAAAHDTYPTHMYAWIVSSNGSSYTATRYYGLDDLLRYAGSSIRITGKKGIRMITGMASTTKSVFTGSGVNGYTVVETGTLLAWNDRVDNGGLTFDTPGVSRGKAYVRGSQNPVFSTSNGVEYYTNVLVGFSGAAQYKRDMAMRSYAILQDSSGNKFTVYGGTVVRSIEYIAQQNADSFAKGTSAYDFVHGIIDACRG